MNNNTTNKKKLELKKTAIANLTLSEAQMRMIYGGVEAANTPQSGDKYCNGGSDLVHTCTGSRAEDCGDKKPTFTK